MKFAVQLEMRKVRCEHKVETRESWGMLSFYLTPRRIAVG